VADEFSRNFLRINALESFFKDAKIGHLGDGTSEDPT
jgi:hypothetical protein